VATSIPMSPIELGEEARRFLDRHRVGHLATASRDGDPHVVPLCYARVDRDIYFVCDDKRKRGGPKALKRLANLQENPRAALVVDDYGDDWSKLSYLLLHLEAAIVTDEGEYETALVALRRRYPPYAAMPLRRDRNPMVRLRPIGAHFWVAAPPR
jgi:coenzyme F420-0:L-glutamate ligase / coenzyme F420-1:gamma-L-glutamate ligase